MPAMPAALAPVPASPALPVRGGVGVPAVTVVVDVGVAVRVTVAVTVGVAVRVTVAVAVGVAVAVLVAVAVAVAVCVAVAVAVCVAVAVAVAVDVAVCVGVCASSAAGVSAAMSAPAITAVRNPSDFRIFMSSSSCFAGIVPAAQPPGRGSMLGARGDRGRNEAVAEDNETTNERRLL